MEDKMICTNCGTSKDITLLIANKGETVTIYCKKCFNKIILKKEEVKNEQRS